MEKSSLKKEVISYIFIVLGSLLYSFGTVFFIFPKGLILGGTSGISVILNAFLPFSPGTILMVINILLIVLAFIVLGSGMAIKTFVGSAVTTGFIGLMEGIAPENPVIGNEFLSGAFGAVIISIASGILFYVGSSSGGTDIIALIVKKYFKINIGKATLVADFLIVIVGGILSGLVIFLSSLMGLLIKTFGIDFVISVIEKKILKGGEEVDG